MAKVNSNGVLPATVEQGGTGSSGVIITPSATSWAGWDSNANFSANNFNSGFFTQATAGGTTTLTVASAQIQEFTGATFQNVQLPDVTTLPIGTTYILINDSTGNINVKSSGSNALVTAIGGTTVTVRSVLNTGTTEASWRVMSQNVSGTFTPALNFGGATTGITYSVQEGIYTRTGSLMSFTATLTLSSKGSATGNATITGWPYAVRNSRLPNFSPYYENVTFTSTPICILASTTISVKQLTSGGVSAFLTDASFANNSAIVINGTYLVPFTQ